VATAADVQAPETAASMEEAYLEYRKACALIVLKGAEERGLMDALSEPRTLDELIADQGYLPERKPILELVLEGLARLGAVRRTNEGKRRYERNDAVASEDVEIDPDLVARAIGVDQVAPLLHGQNYGGIVDTLNQPTNPIGADFSAANVPVWEEFLQQPFYAFVRRHAVHSIAKPGGNVLDLACGPGFGLLELAEAVGEEGSVVGVEISRDFVCEALKRTQELPNVRVAQANLDEGIGFLCANYFAGAMVIGAYHFLERPDVLFSEAVRVLQPGGRLAVGYVYSKRGSPDQEIMDLRFALREPPSTPPQPEDIVGLARQHGLTKVDELTMGCFTSFVFQWA
jgi:ubiquinone/menaquinone biosynthesis C-methylase UbiE